MADVKCAICGEPWNYYGALHGDMAAWEYELFRKGAGCPCCQGVSERNKDDMLLEHFSSIVFGGTDDPDSFDRLFDIDDSNVPKWEKPEPKKHWTCDKCGVSVVTSNDAPLDGNKVSTNKDYLEWYGGDKIYYQYGHGPYEYGYVAKDGPYDTDDYYELDGKKYCPGCTTICEQCDNVIFTNTDGMDTYDVGYSFSNPDNPFYHPVCLNCYFRMTSEEEE